MRLRRMSYVMLVSLAMLGAARADEFKLKIIAFNDFHGNLQSPGKFRANAQSDLVDAGGVDFLAGYVKQLKSQNPYNVVVSAGDLTGASPLVSGLFHDEDTIETMNRLGLELNAVCNHEFDKGRQELLRLQNGGCFKTDGVRCEDAVAGSDGPFQGAKFKYLAANVFDTSTGKTLLPAYVVKSYHGVNVAFIGLTLKETPTLVAASGIAGLRFDDEASSINEVVRKLRKQGIESFVILIHQGGKQSTVGTPDINACEGGLDGSPIQSIVNKLDGAVDLVISGHSHQPYICQIANRAGLKIPVTSASSYGRLITDIDVTIDTKTKDVTSVTARNIVVDRTNAAGIAPDTALQKIVDRYAALAAPIANRVVGSVSADITKENNPAGESSLGDIVADAQLDATRADGSGGALVAFMNEGGIRADIPFTTSAFGMKNGDVAYGELFNVQPFGDNLVTMDLTGTQIKTLLEEQFKGCALDFPATESAAPSIDRILQVSDGFTYEWSKNGAACDRVDPSNIKINDAVIVPSAKYRVTVNTYLADGGDQLFVLKQGTDRVGGVQGLDALTAYLARHRPLAPGQPHRINVTP